jgi:hypothetical protein
MRLMPNENDCLAHCDVTSLVLGRVGWIGTGLLFESYEVQHLGRYMMI